MDCIHCQTHTDNPKFCSRSCATSFNNTHKPKRKRKTSNCRKCNTEVARRRSYCDDCLKPQDMTLEEASYDTHHRSSAFALVRSRARQVVKDRVQKCEECEYDRHVEVCHIRPIADFPTDTLLSVVNSPDNLRLLCPNHHWEFDHLR